MLVDAPDVFPEGTVFRALVGAFLVLRLEFRNVPVLLEDILAAWMHRPVIEIVVQDWRRRERLLQRIDEVFPF